MKILLLGKNGQLGWELHRALQPLGEVTAVDYPEINLTDFSPVREIIRNIRPSVIVNATAYTAVDQAESQPELAWKINGEAPGLLAEEARLLQAVLIHFSTDYVFDGTKKSPYVESDQPDPINEYGKSKWEGEKTVQQAGEAYLIFRTSWVYSDRVGGFVNKVLQWARQQQTLRIVDDQVASPTWCRMLAEASAQLLAASKQDVFSFLKGHTGVYHLAGSGAASRYEWAQKILELDPKRDEQVVKELVPARTEEFPTPAARPLYSALDCSRFTQTFGFCLPEWEFALKLALGSN